MFSCLLNCFSQGGKIARVFFIFVMCKEVYWKRCQRIWFTVTYEIDKEIIVSKKENYFRFVMLTVYYKIYSARLLIASETSLHTNILSALRDSSNGEYKIALIIFFIYWFDY